MRTDSFAGQVVAVLSRRADAFQPGPEEPTTFPGRIQSLFAGFGKAPEALRETVDAPEHYEERHRPGVIVISPPAPAWSTDWDQSPQGRRRRSPKRLALVAAVVFGIAVAGAASTRLFLPAGSEPNLSPVVYGQPSRGLPTDPEQTLGDQSGSARAVAFSPSGNIVASGTASGTTYLWGTTSGSIKALTDKSAGVSPSQGVNAVAFSHDGQLLAVGDQNGFTFVFNTDGRPVYRPLQDVNTLGGVQAVAFNPNGTLLATGDGNGSVNLWDAATGAFLSSIRTPGGQSIRAVAFSSDGRMLAVGDAAGGATVWQVGSQTTTPRLEATLPATAGGKIVTAVAFSSDDVEMAVASSDGTTRMWDLVSGHLIRTFLDPASGGVTSAFFDPNSSNLLATGDVNGHVYLWDTTDTADPISLTAPDSHSIVAVAFSPDGKKLIAGETNAKTYLWTVNSQPNGTQLGKYTVTVPAGWYVRVGPSAPTVSQESTLPSGALEYKTISGFAYLAPVAPFSTIAPYNGVPTYLGCSQDHNTQNTVSATQGSSFCLFEPTSDLVVGGVVTSIDQTAINPTSVTLRLTVWQYAP